MIFGFLARKHRSLDANLPVPPVVAETFYLTIEDKAT
jgi:hypothetical protein